MSSNGEIKTYPVVEMEFHPEANQVEYVICPARIDDNIAKKAREIALKVADAFDFNLILTLFNKIMSCVGSVFGDKYKSNLYVSEYSS